MKKNRGINQINTGDLIFSMLENEIEGRVKNAKKGRAAAPGMGIRGGGVETSAPACLTSASRSCYTRGV